MEPPDDRVPARGGHQHHAGATQVDRGHAERSEKLPERKLAVAPRHRVVFAPERRLSDGREQSGDLLQHLARQGEADLLVEISNFPPPRGPRKRASKKPATAGSLLS